MSRIENALEKASRMRTFTDGKIPVHDDPVNTADAVAAGGLPQNPCLVTVTDPISPAAEAYRKVKAFCMRTLRRKPMQTVIAVTSCTSGEGKTLTSINLAVSLSQEIGQRALLIDADLRRSSVGPQLGIETGVGLSDCLRGAVRPADAIVQTGVPRLDLLPAGTRARNVVELLSSPAMRALLADLKRSSPDRYVVIDMPPILPFAEAQIVSLLGDGVLFVVKEGSCTAEDLQDAMEILQGATLLGIVFNNVTAASLHNRLAHYYQYYAAEQQREG